MRMRTILRGALAVALAAGPAAALPGSLDASFGNGGIARTNVRLDGHLGLAGAFGVALLDDGGLLAVGDEDEWYGDFALVRWRADGTLDAAFGIGGRVLTDFAVDADRARAVVARPDGTFVVAGSAVVAGASRLALACYRADGSLEPSFGVAGKVLTAIGESAEARAIALQPDGAIVVAGTATVAGSARFALARYDVGGALDASFGSGGIATNEVLGADDAAWAVALQSDGKVVAAGYALNGATRNLALARYLADGTLDPGFGSAGTVTTAVAAGNATVFGVAVRADGRVIVAGDNRPTQWDLADRLIVVQYATDGTLDPAFGASGSVVLAIEGNVRALGLQADGKTVVAGTAYVDPSFDFLLTRFDADGGLDASFGAAGIVTTPIDVDPGAAEHRDGASAVALHPDGSIVTVGFGTTGIGSAFAAARHTADGNLDPAFGDAGVTSATIGGTYDTAEALAVLPDGRLITAGASHDGMWSYLGMVRHDPDGSVDESFGAHGRVVTGPDLGWFNSAASHVLPQPDGKLLVVGVSNEPVLLRYQTDGALDATFGVGGVAPSGIGFASDVQQQDGKLVAAGSAPGLPWTRFKVARFNLDGTFDTTFGAGGAVETAVGVASSFATSLVVQPDGKVVAAGRASQSFSSGVAIVRYGPDGTLDESFAAGGIAFPVPNIPNGIARALALQADGKLLVAGDSGGAIFVARHETDGSLDPSFGDGGKVIVSGAPGNWEEATDILLQGDGRILLVGHSTSQGPGRGIAVFRLLPSGVLDEAFGDGGVSFVPAAWWAGKAVLQAADRLVVGGYGAEEAYEDHYLARFDLGAVGGDCLPVARACRGAAKASLLVRDNLDDRRDKLVVKWSRADSVAVEEIADPTADAAYSMCFYDDRSELLPDATIRIPAGPRWAAAGSRGFGYRDRDGAAHGVQRVVLLSSDRDAAKALVKGRGPELPAIAPPLPVPLTVQLVNERNGSCVEATFDAADVNRNQLGLFKAKSSRP